MEAFLSLWIPIISIMILVLIILIIKDWRVVRKAKKTLRERGEDAARQLIQESDHETIMRNYGYSKAAPDQTDFDAGFQRVIKDWMD